MLVRDSVVASYEFVRPLRPGPHHVALVGGDSRADRIGNQATGARLAELLPADRVIDLTRLTLDEMRERVGTRPDDTYRLVGDVLSDHGPGIPATAMQRLLDPSSRPSRTGSALGCRSHVRLWRRPADGSRPAPIPTGGAVFTVWLPEAEPDAAAQPAAV